MVKPQKVKEKIEACSQGITSLLKHYSHLREANHLFERIRHVSNDPDRVTYFSYLLIEYSLKLAEDLPDFQDLMEDIASLLPLEGKGYKQIKSVLSKRIKGKWRNVLLISARQYFPVVLGEWQEELRKSERKILEELYPKEWKISTKKIEESLKTNSHTAERVLGNLYRERESVVRMDRYLLFLDLLSERMHEVLGNDTSTSIESLLESINDITIRAGSREIEEIMGSLVGGLIAFIREDY